MVEPMDQETFHHFREVVAKMTGDHPMDRSIMVDTLGKVIGGELATSVERLAKTTDEGLKCLETLEGGGGGGIYKTQGRGTEYLQSLLSVKARRWSLRPAGHGHRPNAPYVAF